MAKKKTVEELLREQQLFEEQWERLEKRKRALEMKKKKMFRQTLTAAQDLFLDYGLDLKDLFLTVGVASYIKEQIEAGHISIESLTEHGNAIIAAKVKTVESVNNGDQQEG